ncbi:hypothetical protein Dda_5943 [Drechslerella dactyloides]|uniref:Uncharacterized protein n=1 Tax=Drechslerella dactyloides TaxID=74499 RepID=A0AAD6IZ30_DREDA|nr:hypothetical protein Dda_5943 [Drechslerella dactyloides]
MTSTVFTSISGGRTREGFRAPGCGSRASGTLTRRALLSDADASASCFLFFLFFLLPPSMT